MVIKEAVCKTNTILESLEFINIERSIVEVPLVESNDSYMIHLENLIEFQENYSDFDSMIKDICKINSISEDSLRYSIYDSTILESYNSLSLLTSIPKDKLTILNRLNETNDSFIKNSLDNIDSILNEEFFHGRGIQHGKMMDTPDELVNLYKTMNDGLERDIKALFSAKSEEEFNNIKGALRDSMVRDKLEAVSRRHFAKAQGGFNFFGTPAVSADAMNIKDQQSWIDDMELEKYPKSKIAQVIQKLRGLYQGIMHKWGRGIDYRVDPRIPLKTRQRVIGMIKSLVTRIAASILRVIDKLLRFLQNKADKD